MKDVKYEELSGIVEFIYHGEVSIDQECLPGFLQAAESLRIKGLTEDKKEESSDKNDDGEENTNRSAIIHKALKKLINGVNNHESTVTVNNNDEIAASGDHGMGEEEEEEALSESEIPESNMKGLDFHTLYQNFMSGGSVSEDSDGSKDLIAAGDDAAALNINFGDSNSPSK